jgi:hypothetical protein
MTHNGQAASDSGYKVVVITNSSAPPSIAEPIRDHGLGVVGVIDTQQHFSL